MRNWFRHKMKSRHFRRPIAWTSFALNVSRITSISEGFRVFLRMVVFEAEASGGSKAGGLPTLPFPLSLPSPFPFPLSFQTNQWEGRSNPVRGGSSPAT